MLVPGGWVVVDVGAANTVFAVLLAVEEARAILFGVVAALVEDELAAPVEAAALSS